MRSSRAASKVAGGFLAAFLLTLLCLGEEKPVQKQSVASDSTDAPITILEFADFQCPFCARQAPILRKLQAEYPGRVDIKFKNFPLTSHAQARTAHLAALAAQDQGKFWEMHDLIYANAGHISKGDLERYAGQLGLDQNRFHESLQSGNSDRILSSDIAEGDRLGITATPTLLIDGRKFTGLQTYQFLKRIIEAKLKGETWDMPGNDGAIPAVRVSTDHAPSRGPASATVTIVEFSDFQCPFCAQALPLLDHLLKSPGANVRWVFKNFPLSIHADAPLAHMAAAAAGEQGKFWEMHDLIFSHQKTIKREDLMSFAARLGLDMARFQQDLANPQLQARIDEDKQEGTSLGVQGTPTFVINGDLVSGLSETTLRRVVDWHLAGNATLPENGVPANRPPSAGSLPALDLALGPSDAPVKIEWYADLGSPLTPAAAIALEQFLSSHPGMVRVQFRNFIVPNRDGSMLLHEFALAAAAQGKFWTIEALLLSDRKPKGRDELRHLADEAGLDQIKLWADIDTKKYDAVVFEDLQRAAEQGIKGTPTFVVDGKNHEGVNGLLALSKDEKTKRYAAEQ